MAADQYQLRVAGMSCEHCRCRVQRALEAVGGVRRVETDLRTGTANVETDPQATSREQLVATIEELGYTVEP